MNRFKQAIPLDANRFAFTNNGAVTLQSSSDPVLDLFFLAGASRGKNIVPVYEAAYAVDPVLTTRVALWMRDCRGGAGEREQFRSYLSFLEKNDPDMAAMIIASGKIPELGRWDDMLVFTHAGLQSMAYAKIADGLSNPNTMGLVAKWMPRQGAVARNLAKWFHMTPRSWRKLLVRSTNVVEQKMCAKEWSEINFSHVPSLAASRYQKAFTKHAPAQYNAWKAALVRGDKGVKVNASTLYPYDVLKSGRWGDLTVSEAQWAALPDYMGDNAKRILPLPDVSGSMTAPVAGIVTAMDVSVSLALYIADRQKGEFHNVVMNFSDKSEIIELTGKTLLDRANEVRGMAWGGSTNLSGAFENLLLFGERHGLTDEDMPEMILVISDMEFNSVGRMTNMEKIERAYKKAGYTLPEIVYWNVNGRQGNVPVPSGKKGVALIGGFSPAIVKSVLSSKSVTPRDTMLETIMNERYTINVD